MHFTSFTIFFASTAMMLTGLVQATPIQDTPKPFTASAAVTSASASANPIGSIPQTQDGKLITNNALALKLPKISIPKIGTVFSGFSGSTSSSSSNGTVTTCDLMACAEAMGPAAQDCLGAATSRGLNIIDDGECVDQLIKLGTNIPAACSACISQLKSWL